MTPLKRNAVAILNSYISYYGRFPIRRPLPKLLKKRCFIIGNGPSLRNVDLSLLKDEFTIACNYFMIDKKQIHGFSPTILCAGDRTCSLHILTRDVPKIQTDDEPIIILHPTHPYLLTDANLAIKYKAVKNYYSYQHIYSFLRMKDFTLTKGLITKDQFVRNYKEHCFVYRNVIPMISMHIAEKLGFKEIYLLGCDFDNFLVHFYKTKTNVNPRYPQKNYDAAYNGFLRKKAVLAKKKIKVFNCNSKSKLDMFPFVDLTSVLDNSQPFVPDPPTSSSVG